jgi:hypothetical protein
MTLSPPYTCFAGIDIAAKTFVAVWATLGQAPSPPRTFDQTEAGFAAFQAQFPSTGAPAQILIAMEATGSSPKGSPDSLGGRAAPSRLRGGGAQSQIRQKVRRIPPAPLQNRCPGRARPAVICY